MRRILVLGAGGFVGRSLVAGLATRPDIIPVALVRGAASGFPDGVELRRADATDAGMLAHALRGVDAAVNCIAGSEATMTAATRNLCAAAGSAGLRRVVHLSSMAVYGAATGTVDEDHPLDDAGSAYARSKIACEAMVRALRDVETLILRPGCVHGPGSPQWTERIARLLRQSRIGDLAENGDGICNLTFIDDLVRAILEALHRPGAAGRVFNVSDPDPRSWNSYLMDFGRAIGAVPVSRVSARWQTIETRLLAPALAVAERGASKLRLGLTMPASVTPSMARLWRQEVTLDHRRADIGLGFVRTARPDAIAAAARWIRASARSLQ